MDLLRASLTGNYQPHGQEADADVILAFAFGRGQGTPGVVNEALADFAVEKARALNIRIVAQLAVADAIENRGLSELLVARVDPRDAAEAHYMSTGNILERSHGLIDPKSNVMIVAQAHHLPRADRQATRHGYETIVPEGLPDVWDPDSIFQEMHCRSPRIWALREPLILAVNKATGKI
jgi:hypothetical protein